MGRGNWERHVIINTQPGDQTVNDAVKHLKSKPIREQWQERQVIELEHLVGRKLRPTDKVHLVGHGGQSTLGGIDATDLALKVRKSLEKVGQISLVMCGTDDVNNAEIFANLVSEGEGGCQAAVYAYKAPLTVKANGKKLADDTGLGAQFGIEEVLSQARQVKHGVNEQAIIDLDVSEPPQVAGENTVADD
jgi:hypothetical protein